jgi:hypothetical protein
VSGSAPQCGIPIYYVVVYGRYLVIDEADRMMANITDNWLACLESAVYR